MCYITVIFILCTLYGTPYMCLNINSCIYLVYISGTPYVCRNIILLSTPTIADVTNIAHRERVPNGALPKLGRVLTPLWGKATPSSTWRCASLFHRLYCHVNLLLPEYVCLTDADTAKNYWPNNIYTQDIIVHWYYWTRLLIKIISFTGCKSFLKSLCVHGHIYCFHHRVLGHKYMELLLASYYVIPEYRHILR